MIASQTQWLSRRVSRLEEHRGAIEVIEDGEIRGEVLKRWYDVIALKALWTPRGEAIDIE